MPNNIFDFMAKRIAVIAIFFTLTPLTLFASIFALISIYPNNVQGGSPTAQSENRKIQVYTAPKNSNDFPSVNIQVVAEDARSIIIKNYLDKANSPLSPYSEMVVEVSDKYGLDYRLLPAIAQKESGLCRRIPEGSHNC